MSEVAFKHKVTKIRTVGDTYLAVCGMFTSRLDATRRVLDFAVDVRLLLGRFNQVQGVNLSMRYLIHAGEINAGIIGKLKFSFDLWGKTVNELSAVHRTTLPNQIVVTDTVHTRLRDFYQFEQIPDRQLWTYQEMLTAKS